MAEVIFDKGFLKRLKQLIQDEKNEHKHEHYKASIEHAEEMSWHVYGYKPETLLKRVRPREDPAITAYRLDSYEPITKSICKKALSITHKVFNSKLYSIRFDDDEKAQRLKSYSLEDYPRFNSVVNYLANYVLKKMIADPNGILLVQPNDYNITASQRVEPIVTCYSSKDIHDMGRDFILLFDKYIENGKEKEWKYTYVDRINIYQLSVKPNGQTLTVTVEYSYAHNFKDSYGSPELPYWYLGGEYSDKHYGLYESFFSPAIPFWNEAINDHSDVTGAYRMHMWPQKWEVADECEYVESEKYPCNGGYIFNAEKGSKYPCPECKGYGRKSIKSPYETYWVNRDKFTGTDGTANVDVPFGYVSVPVEATKMLEEKAARNLEMGLNALAMDVVNKIGENQSGISKEIDRSELNDFLQKIADQFFEVHLPNIYYYFAKYMFAVDSPDKIKDVQPEISKPTQFDIYSTTELTKQFSEAKTAKLNPSYLTVKQAEIQGREFQTHPELLQTLNLELMLDPLSEVTRDEIGLMLSSGTITKETAIIHDNIKTFINRALEDNKGFADKKRSEQIIILEGYAAEVVEKTKVKIDMTAIEPKEEPLEKQKELEEVE